MWNRDQDRLAFMPFVGALISGDDCNMAGPSGKRCLLPTRTVLAPMRYSSLLLDRRRRCHERPADERVEVRSIGIAARARD